MTVFYKKKNENRSSQQIYTVVAVSCGVAESTRSFEYYKDALLYLKELKRGRNLDEDDVQIFENDIIH